MSRPSMPLVIDARPRGPGGPLAVERLQGRYVLEPTCSISCRRRSRRGVDRRPRRLEEDQGQCSGRTDRRARKVDPRHIRHRARRRKGTRPILRTDRLYDPARLRRALRHGADPERAVIWRLDRPQGLAGAEDELARRQSYQPLGRYWALGPARLLARTRGKLALGLACGRTP